MVHVGWIREFLQTWQSCFGEASKRDRAFLRDPIWCPLFWKTPLCTTCGLIPYPFCSVPNFAVSGCRAHSRVTKERSMVRDYR